MMAIEAGTARTEIRVAGVFDIAEARRLAALLDDAGYAEVRIDLTRAEGLHEFAVALLGEAIAARKAPTTIVGLGEHHRRLLARLGVRCADPDPAASVEPA